MKTADVKSLANHVGQREQGEPRVDPAGWVAAHGDALFRFAMLRLRDRDAAEEAVQECFVAALCGLRGFRGGSSERTWLIGILKRKIVDRNRGRGREGNTVSGSGGHVFFDERGLWMRGPRRWKRDPAAAMQQRDFARVLYGCLEALPEPCADAFLLRELEHVDASEVCAILEISRANLWQRLHRARLALQRCLELKWFCHLEEREVRP